MPGYRVMLMKQASKDLEELRRAGYGKKAEDMLTILSEDPFMSPPPFKELSGRYRGFYSRRLNRTDRVVYQVRPADQDTDDAIVVVVRMRTHYGGMFSMMFL